MCVMDWRMREFIEAEAGHWPPDCTEVPANRPLHPPVPARRPVPLVAGWAAFSAACWVTGAARHRAAS